MNQILFTNNTNNKNYDKIDIKKICIIFAIAIILIAIIIIAVKIYDINAKKKKYVMPEVEIEKLQDSEKEATIKAKCSDGIEYIVYTWNEEEENRVNLNGSTAFERIIDIPNNEMNNLKIEVVSVNGVKKSDTKIFENTTVGKKPRIDSLTVTGKKLSIQASDDDGIKYLAYKWENEDEIRIEASEEDNQAMTAEIDIKRGTYKLQITVVNIYDNEETISKLITGVNEPEISVMKYDNVIRISATHDMGFKQITYTINDNTYVYNEEYSKYEKDKTTVEFEFPLQEGENIIIVNAYSLEKLSEEDSDELENYANKSYGGKCKYNP